MSTLSQFARSIGIGLAIVMFQGAVANATTITVLETDISTIVFLDVGEGNIRCLPLGTPGARCTTSSVLGTDADFTVQNEIVFSRIFDVSSGPSEIKNFAVVLTEPGHPDQVSDVVKGIFSSGDIFSSGSITFTFSSDTEAPLPIQGPQTVEGSLFRLGFTVTETGSSGDPMDLTHMFRDETGMLVDLPPEFKVLFFSDIPEPSALLLLCVALALLAACAPDWRRTIAATNSINSGRTGSG